MYAIGEIILVVIGILIAVSINNWKQSIDVKEVEQNLYSDLIQELRVDLDEIQGNRSQNKRYLSRFNNASEIILTDTQMQFGAGLWWGPVQAPIGAQIEQADKDRQNRGDDIDTKEAGHDDLLYVKNFLHTPCSKRFLTCQRFFTKMCGQLDAVAWGL